MSPIKLSQGLAGSLLGKIISLEERMFLRRCGRRKPGKGNAEDGEGLLEGASVAVVGFGWTAGTGARDGGAWRLAGGGTGADEEASAVLFFCCLKASSLRVFSGSLPITGAGGVSLSRLLLLQRSGSTSEPPDASAGSRGSSAGSRSSSAGLPSGSATSGAASPEASASSGSTRNFRGRSAHS